MDNPSEIFHYHSWERKAPEVRVKLEKNSKGYNFEITASAETVDAAIALVADAEAKLRSQYGTVE